MNTVPSPFQLAALAKVAAVAFGAGVGVLLLLILVRRFLVICRPNEVLIFSGRRNRRADGTVVGHRLVFGGRGWRWPIIERVDRMDMTTMPIEIATTQAYSRDGIPLNVRAIANVKITSDRRFINNAIERFLGRERVEVRRVAQETLEGTLRGVLASLTPEEVNEDRLKFAERLSEEVDEDFQKLGLHLDTLKIQHVTDDTQYLESIGRARIAQVIKNAEIAESQAAKEANQRAAEERARGDIARQQADQAVVKARNEQRRVAAELAQQVESARREARARGEQARYEAEQELQAVRRELEELRLRAEVEIPAEADRRAREMDARAEAAPIEADGRAMAEALGLLARAWADAGDDARDIYLIQNLDKLVGRVVARLRDLQVAPAAIVDPGDGSALPGYLAGFPGAVAAVLEALRRSTGVDIPGMLARGDTGTAPAAGGR